MDSEGAHRSIREDLSALHGSSPQSSINADLAQARRTNNKVYFAEAEDGLYPYDEADLEKFSPNTRIKNALAAEGMTMRFLEAHGIVTEHADQKTEEQRMILAAHEAQHAFGMHDADPTHDSSPSWPMGLLQAPARISNSSNPTTPFENTFDASQLDMFGSAMPLPPSEMPYDPMGDLKHFTAPIMPELRPPTEGANLLKKRKAKQPTKFRKVARRTANDINVDEATQLSIATGLTLDLPPLPDYAAFQAAAAASSTMEVRSATEGDLYLPPSLQFDPMFAPEMMRAQSMPMSAPPSLQHFEMPHNSHTGHTYLSVNTSVGHGHLGFTDGSNTPLSPLPATPLSAGFHNNFEGFGFSPRTAAQLSAGLDHGDQQQTLSTTESTSEMEIKQNVNPFETWGNVQIGVPPMGDDDFNLIFRTMIAQ